MHPQPENRVATILAHEPGDTLAMELCGVAVGYDEDMRLVLVCGAVDNLTDKQRHRLAAELEAAAAAVRESRAGVVH